MKLESSIKGQLRGPALTSHLLHHMAPKDILIAPSLIKDLILN